MYCSACGREMEETAIFCPNCGKAIKQEALENKEKEPWKNSDGGKNIYGLILATIGVVAIVAILGIINVFLPKSNRQILHDQEVLDELANWDEISDRIGGGYDIILTGVYKRKIEDDYDYVYCNFEAQDRYMKVLGKVCIVYHHDEIWMLSNCKPINEDTWEIVPRQWMEDANILGDGILKKLIQIINSY